MGNTVTRRFLSNGPSKAVVHVLIESDGTDGELSNYVLLDPVVDFNPTLESYVQMSVMQVWYSAVWFDTIIGFNAVTPSKSWVCARDTHNYHDFRYFGGLRDGSSVDHDGKLLLSTNGLIVPGSVGTLILELKKNNGPKPVEYQSGNLS
jgi:hypothetical protein